MPTPAIQTLVTDAQQVLNLSSISAVRATVAVALANANTGTPLNPNLTTQQLWDQFYQVVTQPKSDIESIIANQLMKFLYAPPAPGGVGADKQVIFNDGGTLAGDADFIWNKTTNLLTVTGATSITGDLTVKTNVLKVDSTNNRVGIGTATPAYDLNLYGTAPVAAVGGTTYLGATSTVGASYVLRSESTSSWTGTRDMVSFDSVGNGADHRIGTLSVKLKASAAATTLTEYLQINPTYGYTTLPVGNLGLGVTPSAWVSTVKALDISSGGAVYAGSLNCGLAANYYLNSSGNYIYKTTAFAAGYIPNYANNGSHVWFNAPSGTAGNAITFTQAMTLDASGNLALGNGNLVMSTSGKGIDFSATANSSGTMTSELLNDYEEGTFTATLKGTVSDPTTPVTTTARYTKIGRVVTVTIQFSSVTTTGASGRIQIDGLPFTNNSSLDGTGSVGFNGMATFTGIPFASLSASSSTIAMFASNSAGAYTAVTFNAGTTQDLWTSLTYTV